jgi:ABC-type branched-subunit amino acid transport system substrate-binding protein
MFGYPKNRFDAAQLVRAMSQSEVSVIFFLGAGRELAALVAEAERLRWTPNILSPGSLASTEMLDALLMFNGKAFLSFPTLPSDQTQSALAEYFELARKYNLSSRHLPSQISAYCAARVLIEGLKLAGKDLAREKLITSLEGFYEFKTGLIPPITYGPDRRIGTLGAYVVRIDRDKRQFAPAGDWIDIN